MNKRQDLKIDDVLRLLVPKFSRTELAHVAEWPPDVFAVVGYLLSNTGLYVKAVSNDWWKNVDDQHPVQLNAVGSRWRHSAANNEPIPGDVRRCWRLLLASRKLSLKKIVTKKPLVKALFDLVAMADEACVGMGLPHSEYRPAEVDYKIHKRADGLLNRFIQDEVSSSSLCEKVNSDVVCVLPKIHTPQVGLTFRSLSHNLTFWMNDEIDPLWNIIESPQADTGTFNLLLVPIPDQVHAKQFAEIRHPQCGRHKMPMECRSFSYTPDSLKLWLKKSFPKILKKAVAKSPEKILHGVAFPELSLVSEEEFILAYEMVQEACPNAFLVAGVARMGLPKDRESTNSAYFAMPYIVSKRGAREIRHVMVSQNKHHRWRVTGGQIQDYNLGTALDSGKDWWEHIEIHKREQNFFALKPWLIFGFVVCEDLARQEPTSKLLRAVGPNFVIALLMDGEQVSSRWPARYATVLAEDPGCSVLTLTSRGMSKRGADVFYRKKKKLPPRQHVVAMWRDSEGNHSIPIHEKSSAVLLSLVRKNRTEYSLDGRKAEVTALMAIDEMKGIKQISV